MSNGLTLLQRAREMLGRRAPVVAALAAVPLSQAVSEASFLLDTVAVGTLSTDFYAFAAGSSVPASGNAYPYIPFLDPALSVFSYGDFDWDDYGKAFDPSLTPGTDIEITGFFGFTSQTIPNGLKVTDDGTPPTEGLILRADDAEYGVFDVLTFYTVIPDEGLAAGLPTIVDFDLDLEVPGDGYGRLFEVYLQTDNGFDFIRWDDDNLIENRGSAILDASNESYSGTLTVPGGENPTTFAEVRFVFVWEPYYEEGVSEEPASPDLIVNIPNTSVDIRTVPEPRTYGLLAGAGVTLFALWRRRRSRAS